MNKSSLRNSTINSNDDGIYLVNASGEERKIADSIRVTAFGTGDAKNGKEQAYTEVEFIDRRGIRRSEIVPSSMLSAKRDAFIKLLGDRGYAWPETKPTWHQIMAVLSSARPEKDIRVVLVPGWHKGIGEAYVLPDSTYAAEKTDRQSFRFLPSSTVLAGQFQVHGALEDWQEIAKASRSSSWARLAVAAVFAAPNLRQLGLDSFGLNFSGPTSSGKTLLSRLAASAVGLNTSGGPTTWDGSPAGFEQRALGHRDCVMLLDDLSHLVALRNRSRK